ncbi:MAG: hypothetical protein IJF59_06275 [Clostridia bacterium]|nr:hypothetical protein [Clostridia bacterium]MBQ3077970.1 hypothetical protein [Clostridia bacterium]
MNLTEKVAYIKGLMEGMEITAETKEGKLFSAIVDLLEDMALSVSDLEDEVSEVEAAVDEIDEDLSWLEGYVLDEEDDEDEDEYFEVECPVCGEEFYIDAETALKDGETVCPECGTEIEVELEFDVDEDDEDEDDDECDCPDCKH